MAAKEEDPIFNPPLYKQRYEAAVDLARLLEAKKVVDMGCAECKLVRLLKREASLEEVVGVDINLLGLLLQKHIVHPLITDHLHPRSRPLFVRLMHGSIAEPDARLVDFDLLTCIEVIEHLDPPILDKVPSTIFGSLRPKVAFFSTPNSDYNVLFPNFSGFRHPDHRFEWNRKEFQSWCVNVTRLYSYSVEFGGLGDPPLGKEEVGHCTQTATFTRLAPHVSHSASSTTQHSNTSLCSDSQTSSLTSTEIVDISKAAYTVTTGTHFAVHPSSSSSNDLLGEPYTVISEAEHPYNAHPPSMEEQLCHEAEYYLNILLRLRLENGEDIDGCGDCEDTQDHGRSVKIPLQALFDFTKITSLSTSVDEIRQALQQSEVVKLEGTHAVMELITDSESGDNDEDSALNSETDDVEPFVPEESWD